MDYQIIVLDLDGTLTNSKKEITRPTYEALIDIQKAGKKVVLASGRPTPGVLPLAKQLHLDVYGSYILAYNGGQITDCRTGKVIFEEMVPTWANASVYEQWKQFPHLNLVTYLDGKIICSGEPNFYTKLESDINHMEIVVPEDFVGYVGTRPLNKYLITGEPARIPEAREKLSAYYGDHLGIYCSSDFFLEVMAPGIDKGTSLQKLLSIINIPTDQAICCGDAENDIPMIESAGLGVAMGNATGETMEKADFVTRTNDEDGVLYVIEKFMK